MNHAILVIMRNRTANISHEHLNSICGHFSLSFKQGRGIGLPKCLSFQHIAILKLAS